MNKKTIGHQVFANSMTSSFNKTSLSFYSFCELRFVILTLENAPSIRTSCPNNNTDSTRCLALFSYTFFTMYEDYSINYKLRIENRK